MTLTVGKLRSGHLRRIYAGDPPPDVAVVDVVNAAGAELVNAHRWAWLQGQSASVTIAGGASSAALPAGLVVIHGVTPTSSLIGHAERVSLNTLMQLRENSIGATSWDYYWALSSDVSTPGAPVPTLEVWPEHTDDRSLTIYYDAGWARVDDDSDKLTLPEWLEPLYLDFLEAVALGWEGDGGATKRMRIAEAVNSAEYHNAVYRDATADANLGTIENGALETERRRAPWTYGYKWATGNGPS